MKGRSAAALMRAMHEWHGNLSKERDVKSTIFRASGLKNALFDEGKRMGHWRAGRARTI